MNYKGKIDNIDYIVISDPMYEKNIWCRYEKNDVNAKNWVVNLDIHPMEVERIIMMLIVMNFLYY